MQQVLYLCTGNYYRSRFAEIFFNWHAGQRGCLWKGESRGLAPDPLIPGPMSRHTVDRLRTLGVSLDAYQRLPLTVTTDDFTAADHVVAVKGAEHRPMIERMFGSWLDRVEFWEVHDLDCAGPDVAIPHLEREVLALLGRLAP